MTDRLLLIKIAWIIVCFPPKITMFLYLVFIKNQHCAGPGDTNIRQLFFPRGVYILLGKKYSSVKDFIILVLREQVHTYDNY